MRIVHSKVISNPGDLDCSDYNSDHNVIDPIVPSDLGSCKLLGYTLVEEKVLPAGTTSCVFDGLNGDEDYEYYIEFFGDSSSTCEIIYLRPNNINIGYSSIGLSVRDTDRISYPNITNAFLLASFPWVGAVYSFKATAKFLSGSGGLPRVCDGSVTAYGDTDILIVITGGYWANIVDVITSLVITPDAGSFSGTIRLWKRIPVNGGE